MSHWLCCCIARLCEYFADAFDGESGAIDADDWDDCSGTWEEYPSELRETGNGSLGSPAIIMCKEPHPILDETVHITGTLAAMDVGDIIGVIFDADLDSCPGGYGFVRFRYEGSSTYLGIYTVYGRIEIGTGPNTIIKTCYVQNDFSAGSADFEVIVEPTLGGRAQVSAWLGQRSDFTAVCVAVTGNAYAGVGNWSAQQVSMSSFNLAETCHTNANDCRGNHCTIDDYCVEQVLVATLTNISCGTCPGGLGVCPSEDPGDDEGMEITLTYQPRDVNEHSTGSVSTYQWEGSAIFNCTDGEVGYLYLGCYGDTTGVTCANLKNADSDYELFGSAGFGTGASLVGSSISPFTLEYEGLEIAVVTASGDCCVYADVVITEP